LGKHLDKLGRSISNSVRDYNTIVGAVESRVLVTAKQFEGMSIAPQGDSVPEIPLVESDIRQLDARKFSDLDD
jgi:DNA recombination protein RmuC